MKVFNFHPCRNLLHSLRLSTLPFHPFHRYEPSPLASGAEPVGLTLASSSSSSSCVSFSERPLPMDAGPLVLLLLLTVELSKLMVRESV
jgi:hypothetical protein